MKVYISRPTALYSGGLMLIAASTLQEARELMNTNGWTCNGMSEPKLVHNLTWRGKRGRVLANSVYLE